MYKTTLARRRSRFGRDTDPVGGGGQPPTPPVPPTPPAPPTPPVPPQRPDGVSEAEWAALGDPGKNAIVRERQRAEAAERALAASRTTPPAPKPTPPTPPPPTDPPKTGPEGQPDLATLIKQAVEAATAPFLERDAQREAQSAAATIRDSVLTAAGARFHDATDALAQIDLSTLTDGNGRPDQQKITTALDDLLTRKPHLGKVIDSRRHAPPGTPIGGSVVGSTVPLDDRVKATLAHMQQTSGVKFAEPV